MQQRLTQVRPVARMVNQVTGQKVNVKKGYAKDAGWEIYFYISSGKRVMIPQNEVAKVWKRID